jgi:8-oxo-dGTP pyrophosphatase MutT (NUDIX family)
MLKHFSATVYVVNIINGVPKVLLHLHKKHNAWYGLGGHIEVNEDPMEAAVREAKEEAHINVTLIPPHKSLIKTKYADELIPPILLFDQNIDNDHRHIDHIYVGTTTDEVQMNEPFKWCSASDLESMDLQDDTRYIALEAISYFKKHI